MEFAGESDVYKAHHAATCLDVVATAFTADPTSFSLAYLAEGNANIIYTISCSQFQSQPALQQSPIPSARVQRHSQCVVLRLRKALPFTKPSIEVLSAFRERIVPLFLPDHTDVLMPQILLPLTSNIVDGLNAMLYAMEDDASSVPSRPVPRKGAYLPFFNEEPHGILMPNLNAEGGRLLEFKPKWLLQSPSAPRDAMRCRTCAVNLLRRMKGKHKGRGDSGFCPFALLSRHDVALGSVMQQLVQRHPGVKLLRDFVGKVQPALRHLQMLQTRFGEVGLEDFRSSVEKDFGIAMALRDCSVFLVINKDLEAPEILDVKFADLDLKKTDGGKIQRWTEIEEELISKGLYTQNVDGDESHLCFLTGDLG